MLRILPLIIATVFTASISSQDDPSPTSGKALVGEAKQCLAAFLKDQSEAAVKKYGDAMAALLEGAQGVEHADYFSVVEQVYRTGQYPLCLKLCQAGLKTTTGLHDYTGMCHLALAQDAETLVELRECARRSIDAFTLARKGKVLTVPCHIFMNQALLLHGEPERALADYDAVLADKRFAKYMQKVVPHTRGLMLLTAGKYKLAVAELTHESLSQEDRDHSATIRIRALAMSGDVSTAETEARQLWEKKPNGGNTGLLADVLSVAGKREQALKLLKDHPVTTEDCTPDDFELLKQGRATFEYLIKLGDERPKDLRSKLAKHLGHSFAMMGEFGEAKAMSKSPMCLGLVLRKAPLSLKDWGNTLMFLVCAVDAQSYTPGPMEKAILSSTGGDGLEAALQGEDAKERALAFLRSSFLMYEDGGVMTAVRLAERL